MTRAATTATTAATRLLRGRAFASTRRREGGKLFVQLAGTTMRAFRSLPVGGADEDFAVAFALLAMKFVDRHGATVFRGGKNSSLLHGGTTSTGAFSLRIE